MQRLLVGGERQLTGLFERRVAAGHLEEDDGDVVLAPCLVGPLDERARCSVEIVAVLLEQLAHGVVVDHRRQAVGAEDEHVTGLRGHGHRVDRHLGFRSQYAGDHRAMWVAPGLVRRQPAGADELRDERVVFRHLLSAPSRRR